MRLKGIFLVVFVLIVVIGLMVYLFIPYNVNELNNMSFNKPGNSNSNFNIEGSYEGMQFYDNMRFPTTDISYRIGPECTLQKKASMKEAFEIIENKTLLNFYPVSFNEDITIACDGETQIEGGMFIAGEGGPTNITVSGDLNIISKGKILLLRESKCSRPNIATHELLHVLGFDHSNNKENIMYDITSCKQIIGDDIPAFINEIYDIPSLPDLSFEDAEGNLNGKYLNANLSVRNQGLVKSPKTSILVYADDKKIKEISLNELDVGYGTKVSLYNIWVNKISINEMRFVINSDFDELSMSNNEITLSLKK